MYDADGKLLIRSNAKGESVLYIGTTEVHYNADTGDVWGQRYYTASGTTIAVRTNESGSETLAFLAGDAHGTSTLALASTDQAVTKRYFTPFGEARNGGTGTWLDDKAFLGMTADDDTGLTHVGAREYDPSIGRFISVDPLLMLDQHQSLNGYVYANNTPVTVSDPSGLGVCMQDGPCGGVDAVQEWAENEQQRNPEKYDGVVEEQSLFECGCSPISLPGPTPLHPALANSPELRNWASTQTDPLGNFFFGLGMPIATLLDFASALITPACVVEDRCLADQYRAWGKEHGFNPDSKLSRSRGGGRRFCNASGQGELWQGQGTSTQGSRHDQREREDSC